VFVLGGFGDDGHGHGPWGSPPCSDKLPQILASTASWGFFVLGVCVSPKLSAAADCARWRPPRPFCARLSRGGTPPRYGWRGWERVGEVICVDEPSKRISVTARPAARGGVVILERRAQKGPWGSPARAVCRGGKQPETAVLRARKRSKIPWRSEFEATCPSTVETPKARARARRHRRPPQTTTTPQARAPSSRRGEKTAKLEIRPGPAPPPPAVAGPGCEPPAAGSKKSASP
jgi:hypothetical protein